MTVAELTRSQHQTSQNTPRLGTSRPLEATHAPDLGALEPEREPAPGQVFVTLAPVHWPRVFPSL